MSTRYQPLQQEHDEDLVEKPYHREKWGQFFGYTIAVLLIIATPALIHFIFRERDGVASNSVRQKPTFRREWRSPDSTEKAAYIHAVQYLTKASSKLGMDHSRYEVFVWVHGVVLDDCEFY